MNSYYKKLLVGFISIGLLTSTLPSIINVNSVSASKVHKNKKILESIITSDNYWLLTGTHGPIYSNHNVDHKISDLSKYVNLKFKSNEEIAYKMPNGSHQKFFKIRGNGIKGYVNAKYLKNYHQPKKQNSSNKNNSDNNDQISKKDLSQNSINNAIQVALNQINKERQQRGLPEYSLNAALNSLAQQRAQQISTNFSHYDANGNAIFQNMAQNAGLSMDAWAENIGEDSTNSLNEDVLSDIHDMMYNDADSNWGHRENFLSTDNNEIGIGIYIGKDGNTYMAYDMIGTGNAYSGSDGVNIGNIYIGTDDPAHNTISTF